ncbi:unnamed protein product, partial [Effrenium voratum]
DALKEFQELLARNCLRRTKDDVALMLPGKNDRVVPCPLSPVQRAAYQNLLESPDFQIALGKRELCVCGAGRPCFCGSGPVWRYLHRRQAESKGLEDEWAAADECSCRGRKSPKCMALSLIVMLQRLCNHLEQLKPDPQPPKDDAEAQQQELMRELCEVAFRGIDHNLCTQRRVANRLQLGDPDACGKMQARSPAAFAALAPEISEGSGVLQVHEAAGHPGGLPLATGVVAPGVALGWHYCGGSAPAFGG